MARYVGNNYRNYYYGTTNADQIYGLGGNDVLYGWSGSDLIDGGTGADYLSGESGNDQLFGRDGNDQLVGGLGNDTLNGSFGRDTLKGGDGRDFLVGGDGDDHIWGGTGTDRFIFRVDNSSNAGFDVIHDFSEASEYINLGAVGSFNELDTNGDGNLTSLDDWVQQSGRETVIDVGAAFGYFAGSEVLTVYNDTTSPLDSNDFLFS